MLRSIIACVSVQLGRTVPASATVNRLYPALALVLTVFAIAPLTYPGLFQSYTGFSAVYNLIDLSASGFAFPLWSPTWGAPYDLWRMDGPLGYWLAAILHRVGFSFLDSIKLVYAAAFVLSAFGMYRLARRIFASDAAALLGSVVYVYFPAHIAAVYVRGAFGEALAWGLFPFALLGALNVAGRVKRNRRSLILCALVFALLLLAQPGLAILFAILAIVWVLALPPSQAKRGALLLTTIPPIPIGLGLGFALIYPALASQPAWVAPNGFTAAFIYPFQMVTASWGTDLPRGDYMENAPYQIGFAALGLTILAVAVGMKGAGYSSPVRRLLRFTIITSAILLVLMMPLSAPLWDIGLNLLAQYPFQLLALVGFLLSFAAASLVVTASRLSEIPVLAALVIVPILAVYAYLAPAFIDFSPTKPALARFNNNELALLDARVVRPPGVWRHGATVELDLTWQALRQPNRDYTVFMHILDAKRERWGALDEKPAGDELSTLNWIPGRVYEGTHGVQIDLAGPADGYHMELGIYASPTGERALTETGSDFVRVNENQ